MLLTPAAACDGDSESESGEAGQLDASTEEGSSADAETESDAGDSSGEADTRSDSGTAGESATTMEAGDDDSTESGDGDGDESGDGDGVFACYDPVTHVCDCETDQAACEEAGGVWTDQCECAGDGDADEGGDTEADGDGGDDGSGCYDPVTHVCDCESDELACTGDGGIWTDQCECL